MIQETTLQFLKDLAANNNKEWFDKNKTTYQDVRANFMAFINEVLVRLSSNDPDIRDLEAKDCLYRINRDVRFSKNKAPYKNNIAASMERAGKKSIYGGYYIHLQPGTSFIGGGLWMPESKELKKIRQEIDYNFTEFKQIIKNKKFIATFGGFEETKEYKLARPPKGYDAENPAIEYLKLKSYVVTRPMDDADITSRNFINIVIDSFKTMQPLLQFLNRAIEEEGEDFRG